MLLVVKTGEKIIVPEATGAQTTLCRPLVTRAWHRFSEETAKLNKNGFI